MPSANAEIYFIAAMMVLILLISFAAVFFFVRQYRKEMRPNADDADGGNGEGKLSEGPGVDAGRS